MRRSRDGGVREVAKHKTLEKRHFNSMSDPLTVVIPMMPKMIQRDVCGA